MQTIVIQERATAHPWLEHYPADRSRPEKTSLESLPFTIGRSETVDLQIDSGRVSRDHAVIRKKGGRYRVEDLGSTNGTFVNGKRVQEIILNDGDILQIADVEFTFFQGSTPATRNTMTQVMDPRASDDESEDRTVQFVRATRRLGEVLIHRCFVNLFQPIVALKDKQLVGYEAAGIGVDGCGQTEAEKMLFSVECRLANRIRQVERLLIAEEASSLPKGSLVFLNLDVSEIKSRRLSESLVRLQDVLGGNRRMVVEVPGNAFCDAEYFREFRASLEESGIGLSYKGFVAGQSQLLELDGIRPDFLQLAPSVVKELHGNPKRRQRLEPVIKATTEIGCKIVAMGLQNEADMAACSELGCRYGQGPLLGRPQPIYAIDRGPRH